MLKRILPLLFVLFLVGCTQALASHHDDVVTFKQQVTNNSDSILTHADSIAAHKAHIAALKDSIAAIREDIDTTTYADTAFVAAYSDSSGTWIGWDTDTVAYSDTAIYAKSAPGAGDSVMYADSSGYADSAGYAPMPDSVIYADTAGYAQNAGAYADTAGQWIGAATKVDTNKAYVYRSTLSYSDFTLAINTNYGEASYPWYSPSDTIVIARVQYTGHFVSGSFAWEMLILDTNGDTVSWSDTLSTASSYFRVVDNSPDNATITPAEGINIDINELSGSNSLIQPAIIIEFYYLNP